MSKYDVINAERFAIEELSPEKQQYIQGGGKIKFAVKAIGAITAAGIGAAIAGYKAVQAALD
ncbi:hypothetical protein A4S05_10305 [Nostoc sp. KVJ20]|uniref:hypothetical protein n=1 Tax=Nostoc sp. KVJ20 TaxID=457944 RepID=UPI00083DC9F9|nr:hypothetical protein [Nostoc sp. KVJ20]ODG98188.1 hypothetical protein A4S05_10305 [Nostoc sp. KVJ20]